MGFFSRKKQPKTSVQQYQQQQPSLTLPSPPSPLPSPSRPSTSSFAGHRFGSTASLPQNLPSSARPTSPVLSVASSHHYQDEPEEPYILPSLSLSPLELSPMRSRTSASSTRSQSGYFPQVQDDDDDQPLGHQSGRRSFFEVGQPQSPGAGHGRSGSWNDGGVPTEGSSLFRFQGGSSAVGGSARGVAGEQERFIKGNPSLPPQHSTSHPIKKARSPFPPPLLSFDPPPQPISPPPSSSGHGHDLRRVSAESLVLDAPRVYAEDGSSSAPSSSGKAAGKRRFMGMFGASKESLVLLNAAGGAAGGGEAADRPSRSPSPLPQSDTLGVPPQNYSHSSSPLTSTYSPLPAAIPRPERLNAPPLGHRSSSFLSVLKLGSSRNSHSSTRPSSPSRDEDDTLRPPSPASSFRVISARHISTPPPPSTEELMAPSPIARPVFPPRGRSQSGDWNRNSSALADEDEDEDAEETMVEEKKVPVAIFRRRQSEVGLNGAGAGATGLELDLGSLSKTSAGTPPSSSISRDDASVERGRQAPSLGPVDSSSVSPPPSSSFARNKGFVVASRQNRSTVTDLPSSSSSSIHSEDLKPPPRSSSLQSFRSPDHASSSFPAEPAPSLTARPSRPSRTTPRPLSSPPASPSSSRQLPSLQTHSRRPSSSFFPSDPSYAPSPVEDHASSPIQPRSRVTSRTSSTLPPPPPPVSTQPLASSPKPISRYQAAKAAKPPVPAPVIATKPAVPRRHYSSTEEDSTESAPDSDMDEDDQPRKKAHGSRSSFSSNKTFTRPSAASLQGDAYSARTKSPSASMFSSSGKKRVVAKPLISEVESLSKPVLDRKVTIRRRSTADIDGEGAQQGRKLLREHSARRGSEGALRRMDPVASPKPLPASASVVVKNEEEDESSDGYGQDDPTPPASTNFPPSSSLPHPSVDSFPVEETDDDDKPLGLLPRPRTTSSLPSAPSSVNSPFPSSTTVAPSSSPSKASPVFGIRDPTSQPFLGRAAPNRSASGLSVATSASSASSSSQPQPKSILRNSVVSPTASATSLPAGGRPLTSKAAAHALPSPPATGTSSSSSSIPSSPLPPPQISSGSSLNRLASPSGSLTGESSSGRTPLTPREGGAERERAREKEMGGLGVGKRWGEKEQQESAPLQPIDEDEAERRRNERRRGEARNAIELGNVFHGPPPLDPESETDTPPQTHPSFDPYANPYNAQFPLGYPLQFAGGHNPYAHMGMGMPMGMGMGLGVDPTTSTWALQAQIQAQQAQMQAMAMQMQAQMAGGDPSMHYQAMMMAKQQFQATMAAQAAQLAGEQWEMSSNMGAMSEAGQGSVRGGEGIGIGFPGGYGGGYAASAYGGGGGGSNWGGSEVGWGGGVGGARSEYGGGASRSEYGGPTRQRHTSNSSMQYHPQQQRQSSYHMSPPPLPNQLRTSPSDYFARNQQLPPNSSSRQRQVSQPNPNSSNSRPPPTLRSSSSLFSSDASPSEQQPSRQPRRTSKPSPSSNSRPLSIIAPPSRPFVDEEVTGGGARSSGRSTPPTSWRAGSPGAGGRR